MDPDDTRDDTAGEHLDDSGTAARFEQVVDIDATIESAWAALSDPDALARWLGSSVELDVRPGGRGRVVDDDGTVREVLVTAVDDRQAIAWHWWSDDGELSSVELRIDECDGHTQLRILEMFVPGPPHAGERSTIATCSRRWSAATSRLWRHVGVAAFV